MSKARLSQLFRFLLPAALVATGLAAAAPAGAQNGPIVVGPPPGSGLGGSGLPYIPQPGAQDRGVPPDFQTYPLLNRIFGTGGAIDGGIVCELVLRAMDRDQDIIYAGQSHTGKSGPREYLAVMRNQHLIHIFRCRPWSGDSNAPVILVSECGKVTIRLGRDGTFECLAGAPSDIAGGHCRALARIARVAAATRTRIKTHTSQPRSSDK